MEEKRVNLMAYTNDENINENQEDLLDEQKELIADIKKITLLV